METNQIPAPAHASSQGDASRSGPFRDVDGNVIFGGNNCTSGSKRQHGDVEGPAAAGPAPAAAAQASGSPTIPPVQPQGQEELRQGSGSSKPDSEGGEGTADSHADINADNMGERERSALEGLGAAISRVEDPFFCSGEVPVPGPSSDASKVTLLLKNRQTPATAVPLTVPAPFYYREPQKGYCHYDPLQFDGRAAKNKLDSTPLTAEARAAFRAFEVSPFGHGGETVIDESVRKAMQVKADRIVETGVDLEKLGILAAVRTGLAPWASRVHATLDKLNLYSRGGHFKSHRDTPRDELAFGTLVIALPSKFRGGCLTVKHRGRNTTCDWGRRLTKEDDDMCFSVFATMTTPAPPVLQWCAFYGDCEHEIAEVQDGFRLTLTYILRYDARDEGIAKHMAATLGPIAPLSPSSSDSPESDSAGSDGDDDESQGSSNDPASLIGSLFGTLAKTMEDYRIKHGSADELRDLCRERGLKVKGNKDTLRARLEGKMDPADAKGGRKGWKRQAAALPDLGTYPAPLAASLAADLHKELKACLESDAFLPRGGMVGVPCMHLYEQDADLPPLEEKHLDGKFDPIKAVEEANIAPPGAGAGSGADPVAPPLRARDLRLKGADAMIYLCAARLGLRPVVLRLVWDECNQYSLKELPSLKSAYSWCKPVMMELFPALGIVPHRSIGKARQGPMGGKQDEFANAILDMDHVKWAIKPPFDASSGKKAPAATLLPYMGTSYTGYFGNEACTSTFYAAAAIVFAVPSCSSSGREAAVAKAAQSLGLPHRAPEGSARGGHGACAAASPFPTVADGALFPAGKRPRGSDGVDVGQPANGGGAGSGVVGAPPTAVDAASDFEGLRRGLDLAGEEKAWHGYWHAWKKGKPDITKAMAVEMAAKYNVSSEGTTAKILKRVENAARGKRSAQLDTFMRVSNAGSDLDAHDFSELNL
eukprot:g4099.t1